MKYLLTEDGYVISNQSVLELDDLSINIPKAFAIFSKEGCYVKSSMNNIIVGKDENDNVILGNEIDINPCSTFHVLLESSEAEEQLTTITARFDDNGELLTFIISQNYIDIEDRLVVLLNNYGIQVSENWTKCFRESDIHEQNQDFVLKNRKMREFLIEFFTLVGLRGTYKTLFAAVSYFGYSDIVKFEEHWISKNDGVTRRYTEINSGFMEHRLTEDGYTKIGDMTMLYSLDYLDQDEPYEEGGLPNYVKIELSFEDLYFKLLLLRQILNTSFIPWDTYITDIVGELHAIDSHAIKCWVNNDMFINQDEEQRYDFIDVDFEGIDKDVIYLEEHKMIVSQMLYNIIDNEKIELVNPTVAHITSDVIQIDKLDEVEIVDCKDFEIITRFQRKDVAIFRPVIKFVNVEKVPEWITGFIFEVNDISTGSKRRVYTTKTVDYEIIKKLSTIGITTLGEYEIALIVKDKWGYEKKFNKFVHVARESIKVDFQLLRPEYINEHESWIPRFEHFSTPQETKKIGDTIPILDSTALSKYKTINEIPEDATPINRYYSTAPNNKLTPVSILRYSTNNIASMYNLPISEYWAPYTFIVLDILEEGTIFSLKTFQHNEYVDVEYHNPLQFLHALIEYSKKDTAFQYFDFDIQPLIANQNMDNMLTRLDIQEQYVAKDMLCIYAKDKGITLDKVIFKIEKNGDIITNDAYERGVLKLGEFNISLFYSNLTLYASNDKVIKLLSDKITQLPVYKNNIYPTFGSDAIIRLTSMYNVNKGMYQQLILHNRLLEWYGKPLARMYQKDWMDDGQTTGILDLFSKELYLYDRRLELYPGRYGDQQLMDYHFKIRLGDTWYVSKKDYGVPQYVTNSETGETEIVVDTFDFATLETWLNKYHKNFSNEFELPDDVLDNIDIYYAYDYFSIRARNGYDIELLHMNLGHHICSTRIGSISKMYKISPGEEFNIGTLAMCKPDEDTKFENLDITWKIYEHFSNTIVYECYGYFLKYLCMIPGVYDIEMLCIDKITGEILEKRKLGCLYVNN